MIRPFGEGGLLVEVDGPEAAQRLDAALRDDPPAGVAGTIPGLASVLVELAPAGDAATVAVALESRVGALDGSASPPGRIRTLPVVYGGVHGPDLPEVAALTGMSEDEVVLLHASLELRVQLIGFAPGFAYLGEMPERLRVPRLGTPRTRTPAGSVAIAGSMTGIYPAPLPGGWRVIGRTPRSLFDPHRDPPALLAPGDVVRFERIDAGALDDDAGPAAEG